MSPSIAAIYNRLLSAGFPFPRLEEFKRFHDSNPDVWREFEAEATRTASNGAEYRSADDVMHTVRLLLKKEINNNFISIYARIFAYKHPQYAKIFRFREIKKAA